jgi:enamine deaminase RidA (YjgF/YER057c/UK114 family)
MLRPMPRMTAGWIPNFQSREVVSLVASLAFVIGLNLPAADAPLFHVRLPDGGAFPEGTIVADQPLAVTTQVFPVSGGQLVGAGDPARQTQAVLHNLQFLLTMAQSSMRHIARLHVSIAPGVRADSVERVIAETLPRGWLPAMTLVEAELPVPGALVAMDAVAVSDSWAPPGQVNQFRALAFPGGGAVSHVAVMPAGRKVFLSGQSVKADTLREAARDTFKSLGLTLDHLHLGRQHIVQVKAFLKPVERAAEFEQSLVEFFDGATVPPLVTAGWTNAGQVEIEMLVSSPRPAHPQEPPVVFSAPPHLPESPAFSRVATYNRGRLLFTSGLRGPAGQDAATQVRESFSRLRTLLQPAGGAMSDLAKTTYYVTGDDALKAFRDVRPDYIDPKRPPASSLVSVRGVASPGAGFVMDIIGVVP